MTLPGETVATGAPGPWEDNRITGPMVLMSAAGYYIGYTCFNTELGFEEPYSRESGYYKTFDEATLALDSGEFDRP